MLFYITNTYFSLEKGSRIMFFMSCLTMLSFCADSMGLHAKIQ